MDLEIMSSELSPVGAPEPGVVSQAQTSKQSSRRYPAAKPRANRTRRRRAATTTTGKSARPRNVKSNRQLKIKQPDRNESENEDESSSTSLAGAGSGCRAADATGRRPRKLTVVVVPDDEVDVPELSDSETSAYFTDSDSLHDSPTSPASRRRFGKGAARGPCDSAGTPEEGDEEESTVAPEWNSDFNSGEDSDGDETSTTEEESGSSEERGESDDEDDSRMSDNGSSGTDSALTSVDDQSSGDNSMGSEGDGEESSDEEDDWMSDKVMEVDFCQDGLELDQWVSEDGNADWIAEADDDADDEAEEEIEEEAEGEAEGEVQTEVRDRLL